MTDYFPKHSMPNLPFVLKTETTIQEGKLQQDKLCYLVEPLGDLFCVGLWETCPLDLLNVKESAVVQDLSFKEAARKLGVAASTVSNHLSRVYRKLKISSRTELADIVHSVSS